MAVRNSSIAKDAMQGDERDPLGAARRMADFIGDVVCAATVSPKGKRKQSAIRCRRRPGHRKCLGRIIVCEQVNGDIEWECSSCEYRGVIRGWQGGWSDLSDFQDSGEPPFFELILTEQQYDELKKILTMDLECDDIIYGAVYSKEGIVLRACGVDMKALANCLAFKIKEHGNFNRRILRQVQTGIQTLLGRWNSG
jgi:hypothetical protein